MSDNPLSAEKPIPTAARPIVAAAHRRYIAACRRGERPAIDDPRIAATLLTAVECGVLATCGYYPIPPQVIRFGTTPAEHLLSQVLGTVAEQLPDAVAALLEEL